MTSETPPTPNTSSDVVERLTKLTEEASSGRVIAHVTVQDLRELLSQLEARNTEVALMVDMHREACSWADAREREPVGTTLDLHKRARDAEALSQSLARELGEVKAAKDACWDQRARDVQEWADRVTTAERQLGEAREALRLVADDRLFSMLAEETWRTVYAVLSSQALAPLSEQDNHALLASTAATLREHLPLRCGYNCSREITTADEEEMYQEAASQALAPLRGGGGEGSSGLFGGEAA